MDGRSQKPEDADATMRTTLDQPTLDQPTLDQPAQVPPERPEWNKKMDSTTGLIILMMRRTWPISEDHQDQHQEDLEKEGEEEGMEASKKSFAVRTNSEGPDPKSAYARQNGGK